MKKQEISLLIATEYFTQSCSQIQSRVNVASADGRTEERDVIAVWDTGSMYTGISKSLAERIGLKPLSWKQPMRYADGTGDNANVYHIQIVFPLTGHRVDVCAFEFGDAAQDVLIGMNIIRNGTFLLEPTADGGARFTFTV